MPDGQLIEFDHVTKRFGALTAVSDLSARVEPGVVTAFLGPNGAGKTTTLRILLGQLRASSGNATIGGTPYAELRHPLRTIGAVLEETPYRPRRTAVRQLTIAAKANGIPLSRIDEVLALVGLQDEAETRLGGYSLGMRQRLSVATALLGDPGALVFDEPANGLDPEGIRWVRLLLRRLADEGRTVLISSHVLSEVEQVADNVLVLSKGELVLSSGIETLADPESGSVVVDAEDRGALTAALTDAGLQVEVLRSGLTVRGADAAKVGAIAASAGIALTTLQQRGPTLEDVFIDLVRGRGTSRFAPAATEAAVPPATGESDAAISDAGVSDAEVSDAEDAGPAPAGEESAAPAEDDARTTVIDGLGSRSEARAAAAAAGIAAAGTAAAAASDSADTASDGEAPSEEENAEPSFDDILFGTAETRSGSTEHDDLTDAALGGADVADVFLADAATGAVSTIAASADGADDADAGSDAGSPSAQASDENDSEPAPSMDAPDTDGSVPDPAGPADASDASDAWHPGDADTVAIATVGSADGTDTDSDTDADGSIDSDVHDSAAAGAEALQRAADVQPVVDGVPTFEPAQDAAAPAGPTGAPFAGGEFSSESPEHFEGRPADAAIPGADDVDDATRVLPVVGADVTGSEPGEAEQPRDEQSEDQQSEDERSDADAEGTPAGGEQVEDGEPVDGRSDAPETASAPDSDSDRGDEPASDEPDESGLEIFAPLEESADEDEDGEVPASDDDGPDSSPATDAEESLQTASLRSMLAAAKATLEGEPRDYPLASEPAGEPAPWSVAGSGVVETPGDGEQADGERVDAEPTGTDGEQPDEHPEHGDGHGHDEDGGDHHHGVHHS